MATEVLGDPQVAAGVRAGDVLAGKYRIEKILGTGGMGVVVAAHHIHLDEKVAIKFLLPEALNNGEAVARFAREARSAVKIKSEHVARVIDVGTLDNGAPYMVMEFLEGGDLDAWVKQRGPLPVEQAVEFILQACEAIADAHGLGIVHRDLKPANLFCIRRSDGLLSIKVLDFGISKVTGLNATGPDMGMTKTTSVFGSPLYMSPEQLQSARDVDSRTDIWSLGVILYELLTGKVPFAGETFPDLCIKIATQPTTPLRNLRSDVPPGLEQAILKCLEKDRNKRYLNVAELAVALAPFAPKRARASVERISGIIQSAGLSASVVALPPSSDATTEPSTPQTLASWGHTAPPATGRRKKLVLGGVGALVLVGVFSFTMMRRPSVSHSDTVPSTAAESASLTHPAAVAVPSTSATRPLADPTPTPAPVVAAAGAVSKDEPVTPTQKKAAAPPKPSAKPGVSAAPGASSPSATKRGVYDDRR
jgi:serine/threonine-protein kinase